MNNININYMIDIGRLSRALSQQMFLLEHNAEDFTYLVQGASFSDYLIDMNPSANPRVWTCTCPDNQTRKSTCKHMLFVLMRVLRLPPEYLSTKFGIPVRQVNELIDRYSIQRARLPTTAERRVVNTTKKVKRRELDTDCPICYEEMDNTQSLVWCQYGCGNSVHKSCFARWAKRSKPATCVYCRTKWN